MNSNLRNKSPLPNKKSKLEAPNIKNVIAGGQADLSQLKSQIEQLQIEITKKDRWISEYKQQTNGLHQMFEEMNTQFVNKEKVLRDTNQKLVQNKDKYKSAHRSLEKKYKELQSENEKLQSEIDKLNGYHEDLMNEAEQLEIENAKFQEAMESYKKELMTKQGGSQFIAEVQASFETGGSGATNINSARQPVYLTQQIKQMQKQVEEKELELKMLDSRKQQGIEIKSSHITRLEQQIKEWELKAHKADIKLRQGLQLKDSHITRLEQQIKSLESMQVRDRGNTMSPEPRMNAQKKQMLQKLNKESMKLQKVVDIEEAETARLEAKAKQLRNEASAVADVQIPELEQVIESIRDVSMQDFKDLKSIQVPNQATVNVYKVVCIMLDLNEPETNSNAQTRQIDPEGYFKLAQDELLSNPNDLVRQILEFDIDDIDEDIIQQIRPLVKNNIFTQEILKKTSKILLLLNQWVSAVIKYYDLYQTTNTKRIVQQQILQKKNTINESSLKRRNTIMKLDMKIDQIEQTSLTEREPIIREVLDESTKIKQGFALKDSHIKKLENQIKTMELQLQSARTSSQDPQQSQDDSKLRQQIAKLKKDAKKMKNIASIEEAEIKKLEEKAKRFRDEADAVVEQEIPLIEEVITQIKEADIKLFKDIGSQNKPKKCTVKMFQVISIMLNIDQPILNSRKELDTFDPDGWFTQAKIQLLANPNDLIRQIITFDIDEIDDNTIDKVRSLVSPSQLSQTALKNASSVLLLLLHWVLAVIKYYDSAQTTKSKRVLQSQMYQKQKTIQRSMSRRRDQIDNIDKQVVNLGRKVSVSREPVQNLSSRKETQLRQGIDLKDSHIKRLENQIKSLQQSIDSKPQSSDPQENEKRIQLEQLKKDAIKMKNVMEIEEAEAKRLEQKARQLRDEADAQVEGQIPEIEEVIEKIKNTPASEFNKFRQEIKPNLTTIAMFEIMSNMLDLDDPDSDINDEDPEMKAVDVQGYFTQVIQELNDNGSGMVRSIIEFDIDEIEDDLIERVRPQLISLFLSPQALSKQSSVLLLMNQWVKSVIKYYDLMQGTKSKRLVQQRLLAQQNTLKQSVEKRRNTISQLDLKAINMGSKNTSQKPKPRNTPKNKVVSRKEEIMNQGQGTRKEAMLQQGIALKDQHIKRLENQIKVLISQSEEYKQRDMSPLKVTRVDNDQNRKQIEKLKKDQIKMKNIASIEEAEVRKLEEKSRKLRDEADAVIELEIPALESVILQIKDIDVKILKEIVNRDKPKKCTVRIFQVMSVMLDQGQPEVNEKQKLNSFDPEGYFAQAKELLLNNPNDLIRQIITFDIDEIDDEKIEIVRKLAHPNELSQMALKNASPVLLLLDQWVLGLIKYYDLQQTTKSKRAIQSQIVQKQNTIKSSMNKRRNTIESLDLQVLKLASQQHKEQEAPASNLSSRKETQLRQGIDLKDSHIKRLENQIKTMQSQLEAKPQAEPEDDNQRAQIEQLKKDAQKLKNVMQIEEAESKRLEDKARQLRDEADALVEVQIPEIEQVLEQIKGIPTSEFVKFRQETKPNLTTIAQFTIMSHMLDLDDPDSDINDEDPDLKAIDTDGYFSQVVQELNDNGSGMIRNILEFDIDEIEDDLVERVRPQLISPFLSQKALVKQSHVLLLMNHWVKSVIKYYDLMQGTKSKRLVQQRLLAQQNTLKQSILKRRNTISQIDRQVITTEKSQPPPLRTTAPPTSAISQLSKKEAMQKQSLDLKDQHIRRLETQLRSQESNNQPRDTRGRSVAPTPRSKNNKIQLQIDQLKKDTMKMKKIAGIEQKEVKQLQDKAKKLRDEADAITDQEIPALENVINQIKDMNVNFLKEIACREKPKKCVVRMFQVMSIMLDAGEPTNNDRQQSTSFDPDGWFAHAKSEFLTNPSDFLRQIITFDIDEIDDDKIREVRPLVQPGELSQTALKNASAAVLLLDQWVLGIIKYFDLQQTQKSKRVIQAQIVQKQNTIKQSMSKRRNTIQKLDEEALKLVSQQSGSAGAQNNSSAADGARKEQKLRQDVELKSSHIKRLENQIKAMQQQLDTKLTSEPQDDVQRAQIEQLKKDATKMKNVMEKEEAEAKRLEDKARQLQQETDAHVEGQIPLIQDVIEQIRNTSAAEFIQFRQEIKPNLTTVAMFEIMSNMLDLDDPDSDINDEDPAMKAIDADGYFTQVVQELNDNGSGMVKAILEFDINDIEDDLVARVRPQLISPFLSQQALRKQSKVLLLMNHWVQSVIKYYDLMQGTKSKRMVQQRILEQQKNVKQSIEKRRNTINQLDLKAINLGSQNSGSKAKKASSPKAVVLSQSQKERQLQTEVEKLNGYQEDLMNEAEEMERDNLKQKQSIDLKDSHIKRLEQQLRNMLNQSNVPAEYKQKQPSPKKSEKLTNEIEKLKKNTMQAKKIASIEEAEVKKLEAKARQLRDEADAVVEQEIPALESVIEQIKDIDVQILREIRSRDKPKKCTVRIFQVMSIMLDLGQPVISNKQQLSTFDPDGFFAQAKEELLTRPNELIRQIITYDIDEVDGDKIEEVRPLVQPSELSQAALKNASPVLLLLDQWVLGVIKYYDLQQTTKSKRVIQAQILQKQSTIKQSMGRRRNTIKDLDQQVQKLVRQQSKDVPQTAATRKEASLRQGIDIKASHIGRLEQQIKDWELKAQKAELKLRQGLALKDSHIARLEKEIKNLYKLVDDPEPVFIMPKEKDVGAGKGALLNQMQQDSDMRLRQGMDITKVHVKRLEDQIKAMEVNNERVATKHKHVINIKNSHIARLEDQVREQRENNERINLLETQNEELQNELTNIRDLNEELLEEFTETKEKNRIEKKTFQTEHTLMKSTVIKAQTGVLKELLTQKMDFQVKAMKQKNEYESRIKQLNAALEGKGIQINPEQLSGQAAGNKAEEAKLRQGNEVKQVHIKRLETQLKDIEKSEKKAKNQVKQKTDLKDSHIKRLENQIKQLEQLQLQGAGDAPKAVAKGESTPSSAKVSSLQMGVAIKQTHIKRLETQIKEKDDVKAKDENKLKQSIDIKGSHIGRLESQIKNLELDSKKQQAKQQHVVELKNAHIQKLENQIKSSQK